MGFSVTLIKIAGETIRRTENAGRQGAIALFRGIILDTPVDKGTLQGNRQSTADAPASGYFEKNGTDN